MGKVSVAQVPQDVLGNASREVFQGLFKDLGKQAMAMEAILRVVCGRVDKMENWLTEVSFGMTELDLKLRNIAHNIDGTAAVDDEGQGPHRWAIPAPDDGKYVAPTVSKKLGVDKKAVRVTGMAAAILDRLAATAAGAPPSVEAEKVEKTGAKKKSKDKKHGTKKTKLSCLPDAPIISSLDAVETAPPPVIQLPTPEPETQYVPTPEVHPVIASTTVPVTSEEPTSVPPPTGQLPVSQLQKNDEIEVSVAPPNIDEAPPALQLENNLDDETTDVVKALVEMKHDVSQAESLVEPQANGSAEKHKAPKSTPNSAIAQSEESSESSPAMSSSETNKVDAAEQPTNSLSSTSSPDPITDLTSQGLHQEDEMLPGQNGISMPNATTSEKPPSTSTNEVQLTAPAVEVENITANTVSSVPRVAPPVVKPASESQVSTSSVSSILPTVQVERSSEPFILKGSAHTMSVPVILPSSSPRPTTPIPEPQQTEGNVIETKVNVASETTLVPTISHQSSPSGSELIRPASLKSTAVATKAIKATGIPIRSPVTSPSLSPRGSEATGTGIDPLLPHRTAAHRRSSKMASRPSLTKKVESGPDSDPSRRLSGNKRGSDSKRTSIAPPAQIQDHQTQQPLQPPAQQSSPQSSSGLQSIPQRSPTPTISAAEQPADIHEENGESGSDSSSDGSGSSSEGEDAEAGAAVEEISNTMTALKKLKRAQMLSPEEERELKERAHKKWFQLKGHIKEKQKKDVTNILLKRKKNVFTISSRIELLEEKSREIFAALKQITNDMRDKNDRVTHETLRRRVADIEHSLQSVDSRIASLSAPAIEKVSDLVYEVSSLRSTVQLQLSTAQTEATARHSLLEEALATQRALVESLVQDVPVQLLAQAELFLEKIKQQPDYGGAIENLRRSLKRKADLKLLKELEARLLGLDAENEDCLVRCLSCRKEVTNLFNERETEVDEQDTGNTGGGISHLRKINPGPTSSRIYRSNIPFSAQPMVQEAILEGSAEESSLPPQQALLQPLPQPAAPQDPQMRQQLQAAGDSIASEKPPVVRVPSVKWSTPPDTSKREIKTPQPSPLSLMNITATRAILSPDRPISAPVIPMKKKPNAAVRSKSVLKSLSPPLDSTLKD